MSLIQKFTMPKPSSPSLDEFDKLRKDNDYLKKQLSELEELYTQKGHFIVKLESEIEQLKEGRNANNEVYSEKFNSRYG